jgi:hypothetical protein
MTFLKNYNLDIYKKWTMLDFFSNLSTTSFIKK